MGGSCGRESSLGEDSWSRGQLLADTLVLGTGVSAPPAPGSAATSPNSPGTEAGQVSLDRTTSCVDKRWLRSFSWHQVQFCVTLILSS